MRLTYTKHSQEHFLQSTKNLRTLLKGVLRRNIEHFLKKRKYDRLGFSEMN